MSQRVVSSDLGSAFYGSSHDNSAFGFDVALGDTSCYQTECEYSHKEENVALHALPTRESSVH